MTADKSKKVFLDTNVLVYATVAEAPFYKTAREAILKLETQGIDLWISQQVLREYLAVLSRPQIFGQETSITTLITHIKAFEYRFQVADCSALVTGKLLNLLEDFPTGGKQVHDANIVATMLIHNIPALLTNNIRDFSRFNTVIELLPLLETE